MKAPDCGHCHWSHDCTVRCHKERVRQNVTDAIAWRADRDAANAPLAEQLEMEV